jgi:hypothetical protein
MRGVAMKLRRAACDAIVPLLDIARQHLRMWAYGEFVWISSDGRARTPKEMSTKHLRNALARMRREGETHTSAYEALRKELYGRGWQR